MMPQFMNMRHEASKCYKVELSQLLLLLDERICTFRKQVIFWITYKMQKTVKNLFTILLNNIDEWRDHTLIPMEVDFSFV